MSTRRRLRVELVDRPGALARLAAMLAEHGADVLSIDIHELAEGRAVDEIYVRVSDSWDSEAFAAALAASGTGAVIDSATTGPAGDRVVAALQWAGHLLATGVQHSEFEIAGTIAMMCSGATAWVGSAEDAATEPLAAEALAAGAPLCRQVDRLPSRLGTESRAEDDGGWLLAVPDDPVQPRRLALVSRSSGTPFTTTEINRIKALLELTYQLALIR